MNAKLLTRVTKQIGTIGALVLLVSLAVPLTAQIRVSNLFPAIAAASSSSELPKGVKIVGIVPMQGKAATRMYTQYEYGRTYLYIEHGSQPPTVVDVTKKRNPQLVVHKPGDQEPARYEQLWEGGSIQVSPLFTVSAGFDSRGVRGMLSTLKASNPADDKLLRAFGQNYANLVDRDRRLVYFASPRYLFVVQDSRLTAIDFIND
jgi:hypothetical protein